MAIPKRLIESKFMRHGPPYIFEKTLSWLGVKVGHVRMFPGEATNKHLNKHHIIIPLAGSYEASTVTVGGNITCGRRTVGQASIVPAGQQYSASWNEELEDIAIHLDPDFIARQASDLIQNDPVDLVPTRDASGPPI